MLHRTCGSLGLAAAAWRAAGAALFGAAAVLGLGSCSVSDRQADGPTRAQISEKIYQGTSAGTADVPWTGRISYASGNSNHCTAALIAEGWAITAAHCLFDPNQVMTPLDPSRFMISFGNRDLRGASTMTQSSLIAAWYPHPNFDHGRNFDVGLIQLATPVSQSAAVQTISLQAPPDALVWATVDGSELSGGEDLLASGWGATQLNSSAAPASQALQMTYLRPVQDPIPAEPIHKLQVCGPLAAGFCAKGTQTTVCAGDSGGPLARVAGGQKAATLVGVESASNCGNTADASSNYAVYTDVSMVSDWVVQTMDRVNQSGQAFAATSIIVQSLLLDD